MIALLGLLKLMEVGRKLLLGRPGGAVDALQMLAALVGAPIGTGHLHQLESLADLARRRHVRSAAEVEPFALAVDFQVLVFGDRVNQLDLEALAMRREKVLSLGARPHLFREGLVRSHDGAHPLLDLGEVVRGEALFAVEVVIEAVLDHGADGDLRAGIKILHRLGHHMGCVVPDQLQRFRVIAGHNPHAGVRGNRIGDVGQRAVQADGDRLLRKRFRDRSCEFRASDAGLVFACGTVGKSQSNHGVLSLPPTCAGKMLVMRPNVVSGRESQGSRLWRRGGPPSYRKHAFWR